MTTLTVSVVHDVGGHTLLLELVDGKPRSVRTPPVEHLTFYVGLGFLAAAGVMEWPVALAISVGHLLVEQSHVRGVHELGEALEAA